MKTVLCLLTRNERACVEIIYPQIPKPGIGKGFEDIYVIDGRSTDGTPEYFIERGVKVLSQTERGRGAAFLQAFREIDADAFIFFSPDGNEDIQDIKKFKPLMENGAELVIASRMMKGAVNEEDHKILRFRKWANNIFNLGANLVFRKRGKYLTDSINGFRALTKVAVKKLQLDAKDYTIEYQMTMRAFQRELVVQEFPTIEGQRIAGATGAPSFSTGLCFIRCFFSEWKRKIDKNPA